ncbi:MAG: class I SAM-dependent methyltransferase [Egibacteraceae bacterium]
MSHPWDEHASTYDDQAGHGRLSPTEHEAWTRLLARLIDPSRPRRVLDVGTGTGFLACLLAELGHDVVGIDPSSEMLRRARAKAEAAGLSIEFRNGDAFEPGLPRHSVDAVICRHVLWLLHEPERAVAAWAEVTRPGGRIINIDAAKRSRTPRDYATLILAQALHLARTGRWRPWPSARRDPMRPLDDVPDPGPAVGVFSRVGLSDIHSEWLTSIDRVERNAMTLDERLRKRWHRYLVEANVSAHCQ